MKTTIQLGKRILIGSPCNELYLKVKRANSFANPKYLANIRNGYSNWQTSPTIETFQVLDDGSLSVPRGYLSQLLRLCNELSISYSLKDLRTDQLVKFPPLKDVDLRCYQAHAVNQAMLSDQGVVTSPTGSGKTILGLEIIRQRGQKALIIVHRKALADQWIAVIKERLNIEASLIGDGSWTIGNQITVAMVQTLASRKDNTKAISNTFGLILCDEVHHAPAATFFDVLSLLNAKYLYGLSATLNRRDGLEQMIYRSIGDSIATISREEVVAVGATVPLTIFSIETYFNPGFTSSWNEFVGSLTNNSERNKLIIHLSQQAEGSSLILVDRIAHAEKLSEMFKSRGIDHVLAHGKVKDREDLKDKIKDSKITIGTTGLLGEGIDVSVWGVLILGSPMSSEIKLIQALGRIVRNYPGKHKALVYDLKDDCRFARSSFKRRFRIYQKNKVWVVFDKNSRSERPNFAPSIKRKSR